MRVWRDRRRAGVLAGVALCLAVTGCSRPGATPSAAQVQTEVPAPATADGESDSPEPSPPPPSGSPSPSPSDAVPRTFPHSGPGTFRYASTAGPVLGKGGDVEEFRVAVESNLTGVDMAALTAKIDQVLGDPRSWIASGRVRLRRVPPGAPYDFTIYLATARTTGRMCASGGVAGSTGYTSCRYSGHVVLNLDRWLLGVPYFTRAHVPLDTYRTYMINHEVGHQLGHGHERCPGPGRPAPVMQQQTLGLHGCTPNPWPYLGGRRYAGPPGAY